MQAITENNLAAALQAEGRLDEAADHYRRAIAFAPDYAPAYNNLGVALRAKGRHDEAIASYERALALSRDYPDAHYNLANALLDEEQAATRPSSISASRCSRSPDRPDVHNNLGIALAANGKPEEAMAEFRAALRAEPDSAKTHRNLGDALASAERGRRSASTTCAAPWSSIRTTAPRTTTSAAFCSRRDGSTKRIAEFRAALAACAGSAEAHNNLGIALGSRAVWTRRSSSSSEALAIQPDFEDARNVGAREEGLTQHSPEGPRTPFDRIPNPALSLSSLPPHSGADADHAPLHDAVGAQVARRQDARRHVADDRVRVVHVEHLERRRHGEAVDLERLRDLEVELLDPLGERRVLIDQLHGQRRRLERRRQDDRAGRARRRAVGRIPRRVRA